MSTNTDNKKVIYYGNWHNWFTCRLCDHPYGKEDPLHEYWCQCCPSCGAKDDGYAPPNRRRSRRFCCTDKPSLLKKIFLLKQDSGFFEYKDSGGGGSGDITMLRPRGFGMKSSTLIAGAVATGLL